MQMTIHPSGTRRARVQLCPILSIYDECTGVSSLNININKTTVPCINTPAQLCEQLQLIGMKTSNNGKHLGIISEND
jgi:hypothetical protein